MTLDEIHQFFKMYADKTTSLVLPAFEQEEIDDWVNSGIIKFTKTRYSGANPKRESFEQTQKRIDDLRTLVAEETLTCSTGTIKPNSYTADLTSLDFTYWLALGEEVLMGYQSVNDADTETASGSLVIGQIYRVITNTVTNDGTEYAVGDYFVSAHADYTGTGSCILQSQSRVPVTESTVDTYTEFLDNPYSSHILHYDDAHPLRLFYQHSVELIGDGNYGVVRYYLRYLKEPQKIDIITDQDGSIVEGILYEVRGDTFTYGPVASEVEYAVGDTFFGVAAVDASTAGAGTAHITIDLPVHTHDEIVKIAVNMALENIEQPRYQTHTVEVGTME